jgi:putative ABC transport system substrate-binding protein
VTRVGVVHNQNTQIGPGMRDAIKAAMPNLGISELTEIEVRDAAGRPPDRFRKNIKALADKGRCGLIVTAGALSVIHRDVIIDAVAQCKMRAVYSNRVFVESGGLISYGTATRELYRGAADFVFRILERGEKPTLAYSNKFELVINFEAAAAYGLSISPQAPLPNW